MHAAVTDPVAKDRGLFRPDWLQRMLADPNTERTTLGSNAGATPWCARALVACGTCSESGRQCALAVPIGDQRR